MANVARITGIGTWLPPTIRYNDAWPDSFGVRTSSGDRTFNDIETPKDLVAAMIVARDLALEALDPFLGTKERRIADATMKSDEAEAYAVRDALAEAKIGSDDIDLVLANAVLPDRIGAMSAGPPVCHRVGISKATTIPMDTACASSVSQMEIAKAYIESGMAKNVLCVQSHLILKVFPLLHPATPGLGDATSAFVVSSDGPGIAIRSSFSMTHPEEYLTVAWIRGQDDATDTPWWQAGPDFRLGSRAPERVKYLMRDTVMYGSDTIREAASRAGIPTDKISVIASVQPRGFLPHAIAERLGLPRSAAVTTYDRIAHVGLCGPVINLAEARAKGLLPSGTFAAVYGQGAGFTRAAAILEVL